MYRSILAVMLFAALWGVAVLGVRLLIVEPESMAIACVADVDTWSCMLRNVAVYGFSRGLFGYISIVSAVLAAVGAMRLFAVIAVISGMAGAVLYDFDLSALGLLAGCLLLLRFNWKARQRKQNAQQTPAPRIAIG